MCNLDELFVRNTVFLLILYLTNLFRCQYYATEVFSVGSDKVLNEKYSHSDFDTFPGDVLCMQFVDALQVIHSETCGERHGPVLQTHSNNMGGFSVWNGRIVRSGDNMYAHGPA